MENFPANSAKAKIGSDGPPQDQTVRRGEAIRQVTSAEAVQRKRGVGRRFKETFVGGSARMAFDYMVLEVVIPAIQETVIDAFQGGVERLIRGESRQSRSASSYSNSNLPRVNYQGMSTNKPPTSRTLSRSARTRHDFGEIVIATRQEAEEVLERMYDVLSRYGTVTVADLYELTGIQGSHTDLKWGWRLLSGARVEGLRGQGGYLLALPDPEHL